MTLEEKGMAFAEKIVQQNTLADDLSSPEKAVKFVAGVYQTGYKDGRGQEIMSSHARGIDFHTYSKSLEEISYLQYELIDLEKRIEVRIGKFIRSRRRCFHDRVYHIKTDFKTFLWSLCFWRDYYSRGKKEGFWKKALKSKLEQNDENT